MPEPIVSAKLEEKDALIRELSETIEVAPFGSHLNITEFFWTPLIDNKCHKV
jgi:hypothetical protein